MHMDFARDRDTDVAMLWGVVINDRERHKNLER